MREAEILETIEAFIAAARRCQAAGFDGVEVWAAYLGMVDQFWTPFTNRRTDRWGGSLDNRTRMSRMILSGIREACGPDFIIGLSVSDDPENSVNLQKDELAEIVALHDADRLFDYVTCGSGGYLDFYRLMPAFVFPEKLGADLAATLKRVVKHAVVTAESHIRTPENGETVLGEGAADLVSIVRGQIADPHLASKAAQGRAGDIRGCISCNQMCWGRRSRDYWISCLINPSAGREWTWNGDRPLPADVRKTVLVVGAGPAGLEAARVAAERGHRVILAEAGSRIGGQFRLAGLQPRRAQILDLLDWYERQFERLGVELRLNTYLDGSEIAEIGAEAVILATGSLPAETGFQKALPARDTLPGIEHGRVYSIEEVMARQVQPGRNVLLFDEAGGWRGCGTAWKLAEDGHAVTLISPDPMIGKELQRTATDAPLRKILAGLGVTWRTEQSIGAWHGNGVTLIDHNTGAESFLAGDCLVLATTPMAMDMLADELDELGLAYRLIGDAAAPRQAPYAFHDGRKAGQEI